MKPQAPRKSKARTLADMHGGTLDEFLAEEGILEACAIHRGSTNVYADLVSHLSSILKARRYSKTKAAEINGLPLPKLSAILRGQFRSVSEEKLMRCLTPLGQDVQIVVMPSRKGRAGSLSVAA
jgi:predicted XRE-type DNA-binding protein